MYFIKSLRYKLAFAFTRHENWAIKAALRYPLFSIFAAATLWVWFFVPGLVIGIFYIGLLKSAILAGSLFGFIVGPIFLMLFAPWLFQWYFICIGLMFGKPRAAHNKALKVSERLDKLRVSTH